METEPVTRVQCSNCIAPLANLLQANPGTRGVAFKIVAECPHCGDRSFEYTVYGGFGLGNGGLSNPEYPDDADEDIVYTDVIDQTWEGDVIVLKTRKRKDWKG